MMLYSVKPEYCYGDDRVEKREAQLRMLEQVGVEESERLGVVVCDAEKALFLFSEGYCGKYTSPKEHITPIYDVKSEVDIRAVIQSAVSSSVDAVGRLFNQKCQQEQPGPNLMSVEETMLMQDCCTDDLQEALSKGWRILAVCPQPQRRPDYVLGRRFLPKSASRG
jgi:hypothetical protein